MNNDHREGGAAERAIQVLSKLANKKELFPETNKDLEKLLALPHDECFRALIKIYGEPWQIQEELEDDDYLYYDNGEIEFHWISGGGLDHVAIKSLAGNTICIWTQEASGWEIQHPSSARGDQTSWEASWDNIYPAVGTPNSEIIINCQRVYWATVTLEVDFRADPCLWGAYLIGKTSIPDPEWLE